MADGNVVIDVGLNTGNIDKEFAKLRGKIEKAEKELETRVGEQNTLSDKLKAATEEAERTRGAIADISESIRQMEASLHGEEGSIEFGFDEFTQLPASIAEAKQDLAEQEKLLKEQEKTVAQITREHEKSAAKIGAERDKLVEMKDTAGEMAAELRRANPGMALAQSLDSAQSKLTKFLKYAIGIRSVFVLFRRLRSAIVDSVRAFAQEDKQTQQTIAELRSSLAALKASWGAAFAPILTAVAPLLQKLIGWLTSAANALAMFMAILSGRTTYKKAVANVGELASGVSGVGSGLQETADAAEETQKQLAGFDKLNILQDMSQQDKNHGGGGGGGAAAQNGFDLVEEEVDPWAKKLAEHLTLVRDLAIAIGAAILTWNLAKFIGNLIGVKLTMKQLLGLSVAVGGAVLYFAGWIDAFKNGVNWDNVIEMIAGCAAAAVGLGLAFGSTAAAVALLTGGIGMLVIGMVDWIKTGQLSTETFWLLEAGIAAVGIALAIIINPWMLLVAAIAAGALAIYKNWDTIQKKWADLISGIQKKWNSLKLWWSGVVSTAQNAGASFVERFMAGMASIGNKLQNWWDNSIKPWFTIEKWLSLGKTAMQGIKNGLNSIQMPRFHFGWSSASYNYNFFGKRGTVQIPYPSLDWYAKGGVFDSASIIGVGEAGKEAVVPLERNTEWITTVADGIADRLSRGNFIDQLADAFIGSTLPAMASGSVVPPNSVSAGFSSDVTNSIIEELKALRQGLSQLASQPIEVSSRMYMDRRELGRAVTEYQRSEERARG